MTKNHQHYRQLILTMLVTAVIVSTLLFVLTNETLRPGVHEHCQRLLGLIPTTLSQFKDPHSSVPRSHLTDDHRADDSFPTDTMNPPMDMSPQNFAYIVCENDPHGNEVCIDPVGVIGEWVRVGPERSFAAPVCCAQRGYESSAPAGGCVINLRKNQLMWRGGSGVYPMLMVGNACKCDNFHDEYEWRAPTLIRSFNPVDTCRILGDRTVMFIGDSTMAQAASTLMNSLIPGLCQNQIIFSQSDTLVGKNFRAYNRGKTWLEWVNEIKPDIAFVTVGAHIQTNDASYRAIIDQVLSEMIALKTQMPKITLAWKTQSPAGCTEEIFSPKNATRAAYTMNFTASPKVYYNWGRFYQRDIMLLSRLQNIGIPYLDMRMLYSRTDAHPFPDCLHMCSPGPLDVIGRLFQQFLINTDAVASG